MAKHGAGFLQLVDAARKHIKEHSVDDIKRRFDRGDKFHFVDVREDSEFAAGRAKGAIHLGKGIIERDIEERIPQKDADIVLYCGGGFRSVLAAEALMKMGYTNVSSMDGGMRGWRAQGFPVEE